MKWKSFAIAWALAGLVWSAPTAAQEAPEVDALEALEFVDQFTRESITFCNRNRQAGVIDDSTRRTTGQRIAFTCTVNTNEGPRDYTYAFADEPAPTFHRGLWGWGPGLCVAFDDARRCQDRVGVRAAIVREQPETQQRLLNAWALLASRRASGEADAAFQSAVEAAGDVPGRSEALRRTQVQVELAVRNGSRIQAARLYRDALRTAPAWAEGRFNLGLLYGELELYPEAITEMRRYLYLAPNAPDARAVQDRIYEWEAAMAPGAQ